MLVLLVSCSSRSGRRAQCEQIGDHVADITIRHFKAHPADLWDAVHKEPGDPGIPAATTKETFPAFLASADGTAWIEQRRAAARMGMRRMIDTCEQKMSAAQIKCLLAATSREEMSACDAVK